MLTAIHKDGGDVNKYVGLAKDKNSSFRLMGFGHRVYKNFDPRAKIIKAAADKVLAKLGKKDPLLDIAKALEDAALKDTYFVERKLYPNVDFYSGIIYRAMGFPTNMFTVLFALGRLPGWIAHWKEMMEDTTTKIAPSPPPDSHGARRLRDYVAMEKRNVSSARRQPARSQRTPASRRIAGSRAEHPLEDRPGTRKRAEGQPRGEEPFLWGTCRAGRPASACCGLLVALRRRPAAAPRGRCTTLSGSSILPLHERARRARRASPEARPRRRRRRRRASRTMRRRAS